MSAITDKARDFWDRISPRERRLVVIAAIAAPLTLAIWLGLAIHDGLGRDGGAQRPTRARRSTCSPTCARAADRTQPGRRRRRDDGYRAAQPRHLPRQRRAEGEVHAQGHDRRTPPVSSATASSPNSVSLSARQAHDRAAARRSCRRSRPASKVVAITHLDLRRDFREQGQARRQPRGLDVLEGAAGQGRGQRLGRRLRREEGRLSMAMPFRTSASARAQAAPLRRHRASFALVMFVFALQLTFPYERVKDKVDRGAVAEKYDVPIGDVERGWMPGRVYFKAVSVRTRPTKPDETVDHVLHRAARGRPRPARAAARHDRRSTSTRRSARATSRATSRCRKSIAARRSTSTATTCRRRTCRCARCSACR